MENGQKTIFELFTGEKQFIVPKYQRAYAWEDKQLKDFLEDIQNQVGNKEYFLGTILFQNEGLSNSGFEQIYVVDGQQRITTLIIFMKELLSELQEKDKTTDYSRDLRRYLKEKDFYKLQLIQMDNDFFKTHIIDDKKVNQDFLETPSQRRLYNAKEYFKNELKKLDIQTLKDYKTKIEKTKLLTYSVADTGEATLIFETTNDRGKSLTNLEKTKSFLMHKIYLTKERPVELLDSIHQRFSEIYRILEEIENNIDEDSVLQYHFISHFQWGYTQKNKDYQNYVPKTKEKINEMIKTEQKNVPEFINNYTIQLKDTFNVVNAILKDKYTYLRDLFILEKISLFYPLIIRCYKEDQNTNKKEYYQIIRLLEIFSFRVYTVGNKPSYTGRDELYKLARDFKGNFEELKYNICSLILEYVNDKIFKEKLLSSFLYEEWSTIELSYMFWKYENYLRSSEQPIVSEMTEEEFSKIDSKLKLTIEHIACQTPRVTTSELELPELNEEFEDKYLHSLGNLTFDPLSPNASKGNNNIEIKNSKYFAKSTFKTQHELSTYIINNKWTKESIQKRAEKILNFALEYWNPITIIGLENFGKYKEQLSKDNEENEVLYDEEYVKKEMNENIYLLLKDFREELKNITNYKEKINKQFIGFKNNKHYFALIKNREECLKFQILEFEEKNLPTDENIEYDKKEKEITIKLYSKEDIKKYLPLIKHSSRYK